MNTLYIRLPSKSAADNEQQWLTLACPFAVVAQGSAIGLQGSAPLPDISDKIAAAQRVVLLLAASDVTLLRSKVPPLSSAKLKAALPNLVEDQLLSDPASCAIVAGSASDGLLTIAVMQRAWLDTIANTLRALGAGHLTALPAQLCLPSQTGSPAAAINEQDGNIELTLRMSEQSGIGLTINTGPYDTATHEVIRTVCALVPQKPVALYVPQSAVRTYQDAVNHPDTPNKHISVMADNWSHWIDGAQNVTLNLLTGLAGGASSALEWRPWRWPLALAAAILLINVTALNMEWWRMKNEALALRTTMLQIYKSAYPKETVIIDPAAQMRQKIAAAKRGAGLPAPDDFTAITAAFGEAWASVAADKSSAIAALEYRERSLIVRLKQNGDAPLQQIKIALAERGLSLESASSESGSAIWKIRSTQ